MYVVMYVVLIHKLVYQKQHFQDKLSYIFLLFKPFDTMYKTCILQEQGVVIHFPPFSTLFGTILFSYITHISMFLCYIKRSVSKG